VNQCGLVSKAAEGNAGRSIDLNGGKSGDVLNLQCPDECAGEVTVTLSMETKDGVPARGYARVLFGTDGHQGHVEVDMSRGSTFSVFCSSLRVTAFNTGLVAAVAGAFVGRGARPSLPPTRTIEYESISSQGGSVTMDIPSYAAAVTVYGDSGDEQNPLRAAFVTNGVQGVAFIPPYAVMRLLVPGNATRLQLFNDDAKAGATMDAVSVFELVL
jgi:hypothetical protein